MTGMQLFGWACGTCASGSAPQLPLVLVGYSNGGALVTRYALDAIEEPSLPKPSRLILVSPMIGVSPLARLANVISALGVVPTTSRRHAGSTSSPSTTRTSTIRFPANAGRQTYLVTHELQERLARAASDGKLAQFPPVLSFQSLVDATVSTPAIVSNLFDRLPPNHSELVLFDFNRHARLDPFIRPEDLALMGRMFEQRARQLSHHRRHER